MKTLVFHSAVLALIGLVLSPLAVAHASSSPADSVHFCQLIDFEQWRRDHPRPAGKRLALNVGEPRTVRMIYFLPNDRPFRQEVVRFDESGDSSSSDLLCRADAGAWLRLQDLPH